MFIESNRETDIRVILLFGGMEEWVFIWRERMFEWVMIEESEANGAISLAVLIVFVEIEFDGLNVSLMWVDKVGMILSGVDEVHWDLYFWL